MGGEAGIARCPRGPSLLISSGRAQEQEANRGYAEAASAGTELWELPDSGHVGGLSAHPREYERRVIAFLDAVLLR